MERSGMTVVAWISLAILAIAFLAITLMGVSGGLDDIFGIFSDQEEDVDLDAAASHCNTQRLKLCQEVSGTEWAEKAEYDDKTCKTWIKDEGILGGTDGGDVWLECGMDYG